MNIAALIEQIKTAFKKIAGGKTAELTPTAKGQKTTKLVKTPTPKKERTNKTSTGNKTKSKKQ